MKYASAIAIAVLSLAGTASAADLGRRMPVKAPQVVAPVNTFSGFYVGAHIGGAFGARDDDQVDGVIGGGQVGYNWQIQNWILGIEGQFSGSGAKGDWSWPGVVSASTDLNWLGSVTGKVGYVVGNNVMVYGKGGVAFADYDYSVTVGNLSASDSKTRTGWTVGGGAEWMFAPAWSAMVEYQYYDFGSDSFNFNFPAANVAQDIDSGIHTVKAGVNYHFGR
jgi:outer membrane immunogenic protein